MQLKDTPETAWRVCIKKKVKNKNNNQGKKERESEEERKQNENPGSSVLKGEKKKKQRRKKSGTSLNCLRVCFCLFVFKLASEAKHWRPLSYISPTHSVR